MNKEELQEFRDRCARAMGWRKQGPSYYRDGGTAHLSSEDYMVQAADWKPDEDYTQAMQMRDECDEWTVGADYADALAEIVMEGYAVASPRHERFCIAFASAKQISEAALRVLEGERE